MWQKMRPALLATENQFSGLLGVPGDRSAAHLAPWAVAIGGGRDRAFAAAATDNSHPTCVSDLRVERAQL